MLSNPIHLFVTLYVIRLATVDGIFFAKLGVDRKLAKVKVAYRFVYRLLKSPDHSCCPVARMWTMSSSPFCLNFSQKYSLLLV